MMLQIGSYTFDVPFVQAALSGYSDLPMRRLARRHGAPYALNEVMLDRLVLQPGKKRKEMLHVAADDHPVGGQLMGADPEVFGPAAFELAAAGYDIIDINFGCPVKTAMGGCRGGFHLSRPAVALEIVARVREAVPPEIPVTVKMRRGIDDSFESRDKFFDILHGVFEIGTAAVTVHGRTVEQKYVGPRRHQPSRKPIARHVEQQRVLAFADQHRQPQPAKAVRIARAHIAVDVHGGVTCCVEQHHALGGRIERGEGVSAAHVRERLRHKDATGGPQLDSHARQRHILEVDEAVPVGVADH